MSTWLTFYQGFTSMWLSQPGEITLLTVFTKRSKAYKAVPRCHLELFNYVLFILFYSPVLKKMKPTKRQIVLVNDVDYVLQDCFVCID